MKKLPTLLGLLGLAALGACRWTMAPNLLDAPVPAPVFTPVAPETWTLENGLKVMLLPDPEIPVVRGFLYLKGGSLWESAQQSGAVQAMGSQMRQGGAGELSADELDRELEKLAASVGSAFGRENGTVSFYCLSSDVERVFSLFADVTLRPHFEDSRLEIWRAQTLEAIRRRRDDPFTVARIAFTELLFGSTPYGRVLSSRETRRISRLELLRAHRRFVRPDGAILAVTGKISRKELEQLAARAFGGWAPRGEGIKPAPPVDFTPRPGLYFVEMPFAQASVAMGQLGVKRFSPDHIAISAFNEVFGGGFSSRLISRIRVQLGLAYLADGAISPGVVRGENMIFLQTKAATAGQAVVESLSVLRGLQTGPVSSEELDLAKQSLQNSFIFGFDTPEKAVVRRAGQELQDYPPGYDESFIPQVLALDPSEIQSVAKRRWSVADFVILVVGNQQAFASVEAALEDQPVELRRLPIRRLRFREKLEWQ